MIVQFAVGGSGQFMGVGGEFARLGQGFEPSLPVEVATGFPIGQVLLVKRASVKVGGQDLLNFGQGVEPSDQSPAGLAIVQALIELVADFAMETGNFSGAGHKIRS
jgi:hypothetical protein